MFQAVGLNATERRETYRDVADVLTTEENASIMPGLIFNVTLVERKVKENRSFASANFPRSRLCTNCTHVTCLPELLRANYECNISASRTGDRVLWRSDSNFHTLSILITPFSLGDRLIVQHTLQR